MFVSGRISGAGESDAAAAPISASTPEMIDITAVRNCQGPWEILELTIVATTKKRHAKKEPSPGSVVKIDTKLGLGFGCGCILHLEVILWMTKSRVAYKAHPFAFKVLPHPLLFWGKSDREPSPGSVVRLGTKLGLGLGWGWSTFRGDSLDEKSTKLIHLHLWDMPMVIKASLIFCSISRGTLIESNIFSSNRRRHFTF